MKMIVIGTRYISFSAINALTEACAASSDVPARAISVLLQRLIVQDRIIHALGELAWGDLRPALQRVGPSRAL